MRSNVRLSSARPINSLLSYENFDIIGASLGRTSDSVNSFGDNDDDHKVYQS